MPASKRPQLVKKQLKAKIGRPLPGKRLRTGQ